MASMTYLALLLQPVLLFGPFFIYNMWLPFPLWIVNFLKQIFYFMAAFISPVSSVPSDPEKMPSNYLLTQMHPLHSLMRRHGIHEAFQFLEHFLFNQKCINKEATMTFILVFMMRTVWDFWRKWRMDGRKSFYLSVQQVGHGAYHMGHLLKPSTFGLNL